MIILTGAAGFIGSYYLDAVQREEVILVDEFSRADKQRNLEGKHFSLKIHRDIFLNWWEKNEVEVGAVIHIGARTDTTEQSVELFNQLNLDYTKAIWNICTERQIPLIYASSAATYGLGEHGYVDSHGIVSKLQPLNPYGRSKNDFDAWALAQDKTPPFWAGLKFFNVYGPNEYHKGRMASVIFHAFNQIEKTGKMKLFRSHRADIADGHQSRDFVYVKDVVKVIEFLRKGSDQLSSGLYNLGTGQARTFLDLVNATFTAMNREPNLEFIDTPADIRDTYQYFTEADIAKLRSIGYEADFVSLEEGVEDYVREYLMKR
ncbi:MAG: ADP-glyceromanno-heptose 6-epimerase [Bacteroidota bacterium]